MITHREATTVGEADFVSDVGRGPKRGHRTPEAEAQTGMSSNCPKSRTPAHAPVDTEGSGQGVSVQTGRIEEFPLADGALEINRDWHHVVALAAVFAWFLRFDRRPNHDLLTIDL